MTLNHCDAELARCDREIAEAEGHLRAGNPNIQGALRGMIDWRGEKRLIAQEAAVTLTYPIVRNKSLACVSVQSEDHMTLDDKRNRKGERNMHFSIDSDNNITALGATPAEPGDRDIFSSQKQLASLAAAWPISRLVEIHNSYAGVPPLGDLKPVNKFENKTKAVARIWTACQVLAAAQPPETKEAAKEPSVSALAPKDAAKARKARSATTADGNGAGGGKKAEIVAMLKRPGGATLREIMKAAGWQAHSVRGFIAGAVKKRGYQVKSSKPEDGERTYAIVG